MTFTSGLERFGARHDRVRETGVAALGVQYLNLAQIAEMAHDQGHSVGNRNSPWYSAYIAALEANAALRKAAYLVGYQLSDDKPPAIGPSIMLT